MKSSRFAPGHANIETLENRTLLSVAHAAAAAAGAGATPTSTVTLSVTPTTTTVGQDVKVKITVKGQGGKPTGTVQILDNDTPLSAAGQPLTLPLKRGHATYLLGPGNVALSPGDQTVAAQYSGNDTLPAATSDPLTITVERPTFTSAADGLQTQTVKQGHGKAAAAGSTVRVAYTGFLALSGEIFDYATANHGPGAPPFFQFHLGANPPEAIQGFDEGVVGMKVGEERTVFIPSALGYGSTGSGTVIPPDSDLVFLIKLLKVKR
jgi:FKBP-type peptidyl-prolyl cis-trans isomerase